MKTTILFLLVILVVVLSDTMDAATKGKNKTGMSKRPTHPKYGIMISDAISALRERGGSSRQAILKYIVANYKAGDMLKVNARLKMALKARVRSGALKQTKGTGASGSFKVAKEDAKPVKKAPARKAPAKKTLAKRAPAKKPSATKTSAKKPQPRKLQLRNPRPRRPQPRKPQPRMPQQRNPQPRKHFNRKKTMSP